MKESEIQSQVSSLSKDQAWNHCYDFPYNIKTLKDLPDSPGNNINKWRRLKKILDQIVLENKSVIDIGCSDGYYSNECAKLGAKHVLGIDIDELRIERAEFAAEVFNLNNVEFETNDIYSNGFDLDGFDIVLALGIMHRIPDVFTFLKRLTELGDSLIIEFKTYKSKDSVCKWGGAETKGNKYNRLYFLPSISFVTEILSYLGFDTIEIDRDKSKLKYKRTIIYAVRKL